MSIPRGRVSASIKSVVLTHGEADSYATVLDDLVAGGLAGEDILVVHNLVREQDREIRPAHDGVEVLRLPGNPGYAVGMNTGMRLHLERGAEWIWLLTHDVRLEPGAVAAMREAAARADGYGALGPVLSLRGSGEPFSFGGHRTASGKPFHALTGFRTPPGDDGIAAADWLDGSSIMVRARALEQVGFYDEGLYGYSEDSDLCLRLERAGWRVGVVSQAAAAGETGHASRPGAVAYLMTRNNMRYRRSVAGRRGVLDGLRVHARDSIHDARLMVDPRSSRVQRRFHYARLAGTWAGVAGFLAGRTGRPPGWLPGLGEMGRPAQPE